MGTRRATEGSAGELDSTSRSPTERDAVDMPGFAAAVENWREMQVRVFDKSLRLIAYHPHSGWHEEAPLKEALGWLAPKGLETVAPGKRSAARSLACEQFKSPGRATELSVALPGLTPLIARTPGCASLARGYSLSALRADCENI